jgi:glycosyltransferase involved in cell wall biosynthesis
MDGMNITVAICTHNPNLAVLRRCLAALRAQKEVPPGTELLIVDNASEDALSFATHEVPADTFASVRLIREEKLGLSFARHRALHEASGDIIVFVDADNLLRPEYLANAATFFRGEPRAGAAGGRIHGLFDDAPPIWFKSVKHYLAVADYGDESFHVTGPGEWTPVGAGLAVRRDAALTALKNPLLLSDRKGKRLSSGGDVEMCFRISLLGYELWYVPDLELDHLIPQRRWDRRYLLRLARETGQSFAFLELYKATACRPDFR